MTYLGILLVGGLLASSILGDHLFRYKAPWTTNFKSSLVAEYRRRYQFLWISCPTFLRVYRYKSKLLDYLQRPDISLPRFVKYLL